MFSQLCVNALIAGSIYALVGVGFSLIYQVQRFFHFTHGLACAVGAYVAFAFCRLGAPIVAAAFVGGCAAGALGALFDVCMITPIRKRNGTALVLLIASIGAYLVGQNLISIGFGDGLKSLNSGKIAAGLQILGARITVNQIVILIFSALAIAAVALWLKWTSLGRYIRALANDEQLATVLGVAVKRVRLLVMTVGSGLAGLAGILFALDQDIIPTMGMELLLNGVVAMIVGGRTSILGAAAGGIIIGIAQNVCAIWLPLAWQDSVVFVILVSFLLVRPRGLWGQPLRQATI
jgi:branched-subunit amino acid ABC-type transport system permease component